MFALIIVSISSHWLRVETGGWLPSKPPMDICFALLCFESLFLMFDQVTAIIVATRMSMATKHASGSTFSCMDKVQTLELSQACKICYDNQQYVLQSCYICSSSTIKQHQKAIGHQRMLRKPLKLAACSRLPVTGQKPENSANLKVRCWCYNLQRHSL